MHCGDMPALALGVLVDADNFPAREAEALFSRVHKFGRPVLQRVYGDWATPAKASWLDKSRALGLDLRQVSAAAGCKNSTDIAMVVDAMDLLHTRGLQGFVIVSSDSDFAQLALRLREEGVRVYGVGCSPASSALERAYDEFCYVRGTPNGACGAGAGAGDEHSTPGDAVLLRDYRAYALADPPSPGVDAPKMSRNKLTQLISKAMNRVDDDVEWVELGMVGTAIHQLDPDFKYCEHGRKKLGDVVDALPYFEKRVRDTTAQIRRRHRPRTNTERVALRYIIEALARVQVDAEWCEVARVECEIRCNHPDFSVARYGVEKVGELIALFPHFVIKQADGRMLVRRSCQTAR